MRALALILFAVSAAAAPACRKREPELPPAASKAAEASVDVDKAGGWLYTYATPEGRFETTDDVDKVPEVARGVVRVQNPESKQPIDAAHVWAVDLAKVLSQGKATAKQIPRTLFETQAMALLPPGASSILADKPADDGSAGVTEAAPAQAGKADIVLYGTSWCGACRTARQYFVANNIPFVDKDIERDASAAEELQKKATRLGVAADRVPVLDVRGRLLIGFDPRRVAALLGETI